MDRESPQRCDTSGESLERDLNALFLGPRSWRTARKKEEVFYAF